MLTSRYGTLSLDRHSSDEGFTGNVLHYNIGSADAFNAVAVSQVTFGLPGMLKRAWKMKVMGRKLYEGQMCMSFLLVGRKTLTSTWLQE